MSKLEIIGLSGTNGSGKDTVGRILAIEHGFLFVSVTDLLRKEAKVRKLPPNREALRTISAEWRRESGLGVLVDKSIANYDAVRDKYAGIVMASIRNPGEAGRIHELGGKLVWIDADSKVRYRRIRDNAVSRNRAEEDNKTFQEFLEEERAEMHTVGDSATLDMATVKAKADIFIDNGEQTLDQLNEQIVKKLNS